MVALDELTDEYLRSLDRRSLQALCKEHNIKANLKNAVIIDELMRLKDAAQVAQASTVKDAVETADSEVDSSDAETPFSSSPGPIPLTPSAARIAASPSAGGTPVYSAAADGDDEPNVMANPSRDAFIDSPVGAPTVHGLNDVSLLTHSIGSSPDHAKLGNSATATPSLSLQVQPDALHSMGSPPDVADGDSEAAAPKPSPTTSNVMAELERRVQEASAPHFCIAPPLSLPLIAARLSQSGHLR